VVLEDVPSGATAVGVPARIVRSRKPLLNQDDTAQRESDAWGLSLVHDTSDRLAS
jgi:serine acetyltransferase